MRNRTFTDCASCGAGFCASHKDICQQAADAYLAELVRDGWNSAEDAPRCTKCGMADDDWTEGMPRRGNLGDGDSWTTECPHCEHEYEVELAVSYSFRVTGPPKEPAEDGQPPTLPLADAAEAAE